MKVHNEKYSNQSEKIACKYVIITQRLYHKIINNPANKALIVYKAGHKNRSAPG